MNLCRVPVGPNGRRPSAGRGAAPRAASTGRRRSSSGCARRRSSSAADGIPRGSRCVEELGADAYAFCRAELPAGETRLVARTEARRAPERGERVSLRPRMEEAHLFDAGSGARLEG